MIVIGALTRRAVLSLLSVGSTGLLAGCSDDTDAPEVTRTTSDPPDDRIEADAPPEGNQSGTWTREYRDGYYARIADRDRAVVAFSADDGHERDYVDVFPEFRRRGMPWATNLPASRVDTDGSLARSQIDEMVVYGLEVVSHGKNHDNLYDLETDRQRREEIRSAKRILESYNWQINGFLPRGRDGINGPRGGESPPRYDTEIAELIRSSYAWSIGRNNRPLAATNFNKYHGDNKNYAIDDNDATAVIDAVDQAIATNAAVEFSFHPGDWESNQLDVLEAVLDHCAIERERGNLVVATPTTLRRHSETPDSINMAPNPSAEAWDSFGNGPWGGFHNDPSVRTDGGHTGTNYWAIGAELGSEGIGGLHLYNFPVNVEYPVLMVECTARGVSGDETLTVGLRDHRFADRAERDYSLSTSWQPCYFPVGIPRKGTFLRPVIWTEDDEVHVDDVAVYPC